MAGARLTCKQLPCNWPRPRARPYVLFETRCRNGLVSQIELLDARRSELRNLH